tara:strand:+ start:656 stop:805 length:150 start_codon:yes stop_codon:yes gene_type:complete
MQIIRMHDPLLVRNRIQSILVVFKISSEGIIYLKKKIEPIFYSKNNGLT